VGKKVCRPSREKSVVVGKVCRPSRKKSVIVGKVCRPSLEKEIFVFPLISELIRFFVLFPSVGIHKSRRHSVSETGFVCVLR
jgi:hypothetical protein